MNTIRLVRNTVENYSFPNSLNINVLEDPNGSWSYKLLKGLQRSHSVRDVFKKFVITLVFNFW